MSEFNTATAVIIANLITTIPANLSPFSISVATIDDINSILLVSNDAFTAGEFFKKTEYHIRFTAQNITEMFYTKDSIFLVARSHGEICGSLYFQWEIKKAIALNEGSRIKEVEEETETIERMQYNVTANTANTFQIFSKLNAVSVHRSFQKRGLGQLLVTAAEDYLIELSKNLGVHKSVESYQDILFALPPIDNNNSFSSNSSSSSNGDHDSDDNSTSSNISSINQKTPTILSIEIFIEIGIISYMDYLVKWYTIQGYHTSGELRQDAGITHIAKEGYKDVCLIIMNKVLK
jgi:GNAT superfamily N-acetyltransferase